MTYKVPKSKVSNAQLRKIIFEKIDQNSSKKIEKEEEKMGAIFGLKAGDRKIKKKGFDPILATEFMRNHDEHKNIEYQKTIDGNANIDTCFECSVNHKNNSVEFENSNDNTGIFQYGDKHSAVISDDGISASMPKNTKADDKPEEIGLCVECEVNIVDSTISSDEKSKGNTIVYQDDKKTVIIKKNQTPIDLNDRNVVSIDNCIDCVETVEDSSTKIVNSKKNKIIKQNGNDNDGKINTSN